MAAGFSWYQGWVARDTERRSLRAYVGSISTVLQCPDCSNVLYKEPPKGSFKFSSDLWSINYKVIGATPAYEIHLRHADWEFFPRDVLYPKDLHFPIHEEDVNLNKSSFAKLPSEPGVFYVPLEGKKFQRFSVAVASEQIIVYGEIDYTDAFNHKWGAEFCSIYNNGLITVCPEHNGEQDRNDE